MSQTPLAYSLDGAAEQLSVSVQTIRNLIKRGELRVRRAGVRVLIPRDELDRFLSEGK
jgi:excisionase family DNA binding protein